MAPWQSKILRDKAEEINSVLSFNLLVCLLCDYPFPHLCYSALDTLPGKIIHLLLPAQCMYILVLPTLWIVFYYYFYFIRIHFSTGINKVKMILFSLFLSLFMQFNIVPLLAPPLCITLLSCWLVQNHSLD